MIVLLRAGRLGATFMVSCTDRRREHQTQTDGSRYLGSRSERVSGRNAPMVFASTSGGPTSPAIRSMSRAAAAADGS
jgi:hypothetical protein